MVNIMTITKKNVGNLDTVIRMIIGIAILIAGYMAESLWGLLGIIPIASATVSWCPVYWFFNKSTCDPSLEREN